MGIELQLSCSAAGHAWLMTLSEEMALEAVTRQGFGQPAHFGPNAPTTFKALLKMLQESRTRGFSLLCDVYAPGMSAMAAPVQRSGEHATGVVVIAGPSMRLTEKRMLSLVLSYCGLPLNSLTPVAPRPCSNPPIWERGETVLIDPRSMVAWRGSKRPCRPDHGTAPTRPCVTKS